MRHIAWLAPSVLSLFTTALLGACSSSSSNAAAPSGGDAGVDATPVDTAAQRAACAYKAGATVAETLGTTGPVATPVEHVVIVMRENRSFDQYFGSLSRFGQPDVAPWPDSYSNLDPSGAEVKPSHLTSTCYPLDPPHQWTAMHAQWNNGAMDGFAKSAGAGTSSDGHFALGYFEESDLPFYYFLAKTYAIADHNFSSVMSGTYANRNYLLLGSSYGIKNTGTDGFPPKTARSIFDALDEKGVSWGVYTSEEPLEGTLGWESNHKGVSSVNAFLDAASKGTLPAVSFVDSKANIDDEHPPADVQKGEAWTKSIYDAVTKGPAWGSTVLFITWDESGGQFDHVNPPKACIPSDDQTEFNQLGFRIPLLVVSPFAKRHFVSHETHEHTSILRFIEARWDLGALTARDANTDALLDMFDFQKPDTSLPAAPAPGTGGCK